MPILKDKITTKKKVVTEVSQNNVTITLNQDDIDAIVLVMGKVGGCGGQKGDRNHTIRQAINSLFDLLNPYVSEYWNDENNPDDQYDKRDIFLKDVDGHRASLILKVG